MSIFGNILYGNSRALGNYSFFAFGCTGVSRCVFSMQKILYKQKNLKTTPLREYSLNPLFSPIFDATDHFSFMCNQCHEVAEVLMVDRNDRYANTPTIYFWLFCSHCGHRGVRKIYLEDRGKHQMRFPIETKLLANTPEECRPGILRR